MMPHLSSKAPRLFLVCLILWRIRTHLVGAKASFTAVLRILGRYGRRLKDVLSRVLRLWPTTGPVRRDWGTRGLPESSSLSCSSSLRFYEIHLPGVAEQAPIEQVQSSKPAVNSTNEDSGNAQGGGQTSTIDSTPLAPSPALEHQLIPMLPWHIESPRRPVSWQRDSESVLSLYTNPLMKDDRAAEGYIPPLTVSFTPDLVKPGWTKFLHPQGSVYYHNKEKDVVTNADIFDDRSFETLEFAMKELLPARDSVNVSDSQLVLDLQQGADGPTIGYYFATLQGRCIFWAEEYAGDKFPRGRSYSHLDVYCLNHRCRRVHYRVFPHAQILTTQIINEAKGALLYAAADRIFNLETLQWSFRTGAVEKCLSIIDRIPQEAVLTQPTKRDPQKEDGYYACIIGWIMSTNALDRFKNYHGEPNARWKRGAPLFEEWPDQKSKLIKFISPLLFYAPGPYYQSLLMILDEGLISVETWQPFVKELHQEWRDLTLIATVLLATNVAFLAIPSLDNDNDRNTRSPAQICSYLSLILSLSSILLGQLFARYHRIKGWEKCDERMYDHRDFLVGRSCSQLSILYSLPYAFLGWSLVTFLGAFLALCFHNTQIIVRLIIGIPSAIIALLVSYSVWDMASDGSWRYQWLSPTQLYKKLWHTVVGPHFWARRHEASDSGQPASDLGPQNEVVEV